MKILGVQLGHNSSVCLYDNKKLIYYNQEERLSRLKKDGGLPILCLDQIKNIISKIDVGICTSYDPIDSHSFVSDYLLRLELIDRHDLVFYLYHSHHLMHATKAYFSSGFKDATIFVVDGRGSKYNLSNGHTGYETTTVFSLKYPQEFNTIYKVIYSEHNKNKNADIFLEKNVPSINKNTKFKITSSFDLGHFYSAVSNYFGWINEEGKLMGLSAYGKPNLKLRNNMLETDFFVNNFNINSKYKIDSKEDLAFETQKYFEDRFFDLINTYKDVNKNIIITGGTGLNVVNNYKLKKYFKNNNIYVDPLCGDEGNSIGACQHYLYRTQNNNDFDKVNSLYLGPSYKLNLTDKHKIVDENYIVNLILKNNIVALYQEKGEAGPRALGNRSLLMDPRIKNGKYIMNNVKGREQFRPLACCVLEEYAKEWFDLDTSPHMMYSAKAINNTKNIVSSIVHEDLTCRIQTINQQQNPVLYKIIKQFYNLTGVPILMNTSFNLKGQPIVETPKDAIETLKKSKINYLYFSEDNKLYENN